MAQFAACSYLGHSFFTVKLAYVKTFLSMSQAKCRPSQAMAFSIVQRCDPTITRVAICLRHGCYGLGKARLIKLSCWLPSLR